MPVQKKACRDDEYQKQLEKLKKIMRKKHKSKDIIEILDNTMEQRRQWILEEGPCVSDVVIDYPVFRMQRWVSCSPPLSFSFSNASTY